MTDTDGTALGRFVFTFALAVMTVLMLPLIVLAELWTRLRYPEYRWGPFPACLIVELEEAVHDDD